MHGWMILVKRTRYATFLFFNIQKLGNIRKISKSSLDRA